MFHIFLVAIFCVASLGAQEAQEHPRTSSQALIQIERCQAEDLGACEEIFITAFMKAYEDFSCEDLGVQDKYCFLKEAFSDVYEEVKDGQQILLVAKQEGTVIGFAGFTRTENPHQIYITQLAVSPHSWHHGVGQHLVFSALSFYPDATTLVVIARRINAMARNFYSKIGFQPSTYMHPGYNPARYTGYEWKHPDDT